MVRITTTAFDKLKLAMSTGHVLTLYDHTEDCYIFTDGSGCAGIVLCQLCNTDYKPLMFVLHKLSGCESNLSNILICRYTTSFVATTLLLTIYVC
jgi:hypothetical protein